MACACPTSAGEKGTNAGRPSSSARIAPFSRGIELTAKCLLLCCRCNRCERGHDVARELAQLADPFVGGHTLRPVEHDLLKAWILRFQFLQALDHARCRSDE